MSRGHMASCGLVGVTGRRIGTRYAHTPAECWEIMGRPWFRFRNDAARRAWTEWETERAAIAKATGAAQ